MTGTFYLIAREDYHSTWYQLLLRDTHFCISSGSDLDHILEVLKRYVKRYRNPERLYRAMSQLESRGVVSEPTFEQREKAYLEKGDDYSDLVKSTVLEALAEAREWDKKNSPLAKAKRRLKKVSGKRPTETKRKSSMTPAHEEEVAKSTPSTPTFLRKRPKVFKHK